MITPGAVMRPSIYAEPIITRGVPKAAASCSPLSMPFCKGEDDGVVTQQRPGGLDGRAVRRI